LVLPEHPIFSNNTFSEEFIGIIKKQAESQLDAAKKSQKDNNIENSAEATPMVADENQK